MVCFIWNSRIYYKYNQHYALTVAGDVNFIRQFSDVHFKSVLNRVENFSISLVSHKGDGQTLGAEPTSTSNLKAHKYTV